MSQSNQIPEPINELLTAAGIYVRMKIEVDAVTEKLNQVSGEAVGDEDEKWQLLEALKMDDPVECLRRGALEPVEKLKNSGWRDAEGVKDGTILDIEESLENLERIGEDLKRCFDKYPR